jgi:hypothetical protein
MLGIKLEGIQIKLDGTPGMRGDQIAEVVGQLCAGQAVNLVVKVVAHAPDATGIGIDGFSLKALEFEVLQVAAVPATKGFGIHARVNPAGIAGHGQSPVKLRVGMQHN